MIAIGNHAAEFFLLIVKGQPYHWMNTVRGILSLNKLYSAEIINQSCLRAISYDALSYRSIKNICSSGCYIMPVDVSHQKEYCV